MSSHLQAVRGMNDIVPPVSAAWRAFEDTVAALLTSYGYGEIRMPLVEQSAVFKRSIGDATDIVQKEMYTFDDRNGDSLTLRPEGTASCVRAVLQNGLLQQLPLRLWYAGPMFRHERPQRGRHRQFHQIGVEVFGAAGPDIDAEVVLMTARLWRMLGLNNLRLEMNSLGSSEARARYRAVLTEYFRAHFDALDEDSRDRLERNPLRILDSKNPVMRELVAGAPSLADHLDDESRAHFDTLCTTLAANGVEVTRNPRLVRGLDYYSKTVFEWTTTELGAQGTVCAGGRYDGLVEVMGGKPTPAIGFAMGVERLLELCAAGQRPASAPAVYVSATGEALDGHAVSLAETLRSALPGWSILLHVGGGSLKSRMKKADKSGAAVALLLGEDEVAAGNVTLKPLRGDSPQAVHPQHKVAEVLAALCPPAP
ncbi:MAG: histidine--tRNA ligase [Gammaproteobacteria bacterium]|nr:histidine--tRNA ligase [Gammaproteobacteria bacterium]